MKNFRIIVLLLLVAIATPFALHRRAWAVYRSGVSAASQAAQPSAPRIVSPKAGETLGQAYVVVQYQPASPNAVYELRLDGRDPVKTADTTYTFNGLRSGNHSLAIQALGADGVPVSGGRSEINFTVAAQEASASANGSGAASNLPPLPQPLAHDLPSGNGSLPLLSIIGFGILVGGVISALRTRPAHK